jgi:hypothetical protein
MTIVIKSNLTCNQNHNIITLWEENASSNHFDSEVQIINQLRSVIIIIRNYNLQTYYVSALTFDL